MPIRAITLTVSHLVALVVGIALGIYLLPILSQPAPAPESTLEGLRTQAEYQGEFRRDLEDSDLLHWGEGTLYLSDRGITLEGELAPGPAYRLYLSPSFIETEEAFLENRHTMVDVGGISVFRNFMLTLPEGVALDQYTTAIVWCESFDQFISAAQYRPGS